jgi:glutamate carboxypeptidase
MGKRLDLKGLLADGRADLPKMLRLLRQAVGIESPSHSQPDVNRMAHFFAREFQLHGARVRLLPHRTAGSALLADFLAKRRQRGSSELRPEEISSRPILVLGHLDTVWDVGTLQHMPFRIEAGRAYGPGILDMKSGIVCGLWAIHMINAARIWPRAPVRFFLNSDEETGSHAFRREIEREACRARAVLVLEPAAARGALKTSRKGVGEFQITVHGRSSHAGINPEAGVNAITELARQILRIEKFSQPRRGTTLNPGVIEGGTRPNVVPEFARVRIDVRVPHLAAAQAIERKILSLEAFHPKARLEIIGSINRPPMERKMAVALWRQARQLGRQLGMDLDEAATGGGSDGNFTAALGIPTLDGLGGVGDGAHAREEHIIINELPRRAALLAGLFLTV